MPSCFPSRANLPGAVRSKAARVHIAASGEFYQLIVKLQTASDTKEEHFIVSGRINHTWGSTNVSKKQCREDFSGRLLDINRKVFFRSF